MRFLCYIVLVCLGLAFLRLVVILALCLLAAWFLWALAKHPQNTLAGLALFTALSIASSQPFVALGLLILGLVSWRSD